LQSIGRLHHLLDLPAFWAFIQNPTIGLSLEHDYRVPIRWHTASLLALV
jgi:hypothetical protein